MDASEIGWAMAVMLGSGTVLLLWGEVSMLRSTLTSRQLSPLAADAEELAARERRRG